VTAGQSQRVTGIVSLTFDDGPDVQWTAPMLDALDESSAKATFFMVGDRVRTEPDIAEAVLARGHDVQLHCDRHVRHSELSEPELVSDTERGLEALARISVRATLWRTPWGVCTRATHAVAAQFGLRLVGWSIDTHDWRGDEPASMLSTAAPLLGDGAVVLMHDALGPGALRHGCSNTVQLIPALVRAARSRGLSTGPVAGVGRAATPAALR
jgi:peptidoglycan-N-acetylglucosamine deacetylase